MIKCLVKGQQLFIRSPLVVEGSTKYLTLQAQFLTNDWKGRKKKVCFRQGNLFIGVELVNDRIEAERFPTLANGIWEIGLEGTKSDGSKITTCIDTLEVRPISKGMRKAIEDMQK